MGDDTSTRHLLFAAAFAQAGWNVRQAWLSYFALGGSCDIFDIEAFLEGLVTIAAHEQDVLAVAFNERLHELYLEHRVPYLHTDAPDPRLSPTAMQALTELFAQAEEESADE
jgi:hypothetical protein